MRTNKFYVRVQFEDPDGINDLIHSVPDWFVESMARFGFGHVQDVRVVAAWPIDAAGECCALLEFTFDRLSGL